MNFYESAAYYDALALENVNNLDILQPQPIQWQRSLGKVMKGFCFQPLCITLQHTDKEFDNDIDDDDSLKNINNDFDDFEDDDDDDSTKPLTEIIIPLCFGEDEDSHSDCSTCSIASSLCGSEDSEQDDDLQKKSDNIHLLFKSPVGSNRCHGTCLCAETSTRSTKELSASSSVASTFHTSSVASNNDGDDNGFKNNGNHNTSDIIHIRSGGDLEFRISKSWLLRR